MTGPDICVIVPTIRHYECLRSYFANARAHRFDTDRLHVVLVTEDACDVRGMQAMLKDEGVSGEVFDQRRRSAWFQDHGLAPFADLIPRRSHAETSFGLLRMWEDPALRVGVFIDDDTLPDDAFDYFGTHLANLDARGRLPEVSSASRWVNVLHQTHARHGLYPRGYPYGAMGAAHAARDAAGTDIVCSQGLWTNVPDLDAVRILMDGDLQGQARTRTTRDDFPGSFLLAPGNYTTVCSMNLAFRREIVPAFYQLPMDDNPWRIGRFDDIWSGVILVRILHHLRKQLVTGYPLCGHNKAPRSTFKDLSAEVPALELNEHLWTLLDAAELEGDDYGTLAAQLADALDAADPKRYQSGEFLGFMAGKIRMWVECCSRVAPAG